MKYRVRKSKQIIQELEEKNLRLEKAFVEQSNLNGITKCFKEEFLLRKYANKISKQISPKYFDIMLWIIFLSSFVISEVLGTSYHSGDKVLYSKINIIMILLCFGFIPMYYFSFKGFSIAMKRNNKWLGESVKRTHIFCILFKIFYRKFQCIVYTSFITIWSFGPVFFFIANKDFLHKYAENNYSWFFTAFYTYLSDENFFAVFFFFIFFVLAIILILVLDFFIMRSIIHKPEWKCLKVRDLIVYKLQFIMPFILLFCYVLDDDVKITDFANLGFLCLVVLLYITLIVSILDFHIVERYIKKNKLSFSIARNHSDI